MSVQSQLQEDSWRCIVKLKQFVFYHWKQCNISMINSTKATIQFIQKRRFLVNLTSCTIHKEFFKGYNLFIFRKRNCTMAPIEEKINYFCNAKSDSCSSFIPQTPRQFIKVTFSYVNGLIETRYIPHHVQKYLRIQQFSKK